MKSGKEQELQAIEAQAMEQREGVYLASSIKNSERITN